MLIPFPMPSEDYTQDYTADADQLDFAVVFAILFSSVTGILNGANMSGQLSSFPLSFFLCFSLLLFLSACLSSSPSPSAFPAISLGFTIVGEKFAYVTVFNPTIEVVTFRLHGWCMLGVLLLLAFTHLGHECQNFLSMYAQTRQWFIFSFKRVSGELSQKPC